MVVIAILCTKEAEIIGELKGSRILAEVVRKEKREKKSTHLFDLCKRALTLTHFRC